MEKIKKIDCSTSQKAFASKLKDKPQTYFFNGKWGSGKTTFIKEMAESHNIRLIEINLWKTDSKGSIFAHAFRKLHPLVFFTMISSLIILFIVSSLAIKDSFLVLLAISLIALGKYLLPTPDDIYLWLLKMTGLPRFNKKFFPYSIFNFAPYSWFGLRFMKKTSQNVILFDDFDRAKSKQQEQAYILFTILREKYKTPIIFVGDYSKIEKVDDGFIQKIIDERIELPYRLEPRNQWDTFYQKLCEKLEELEINFQISPDFKRYYEHLNPSLRIQEQYFQYIEDELFTLNLYSSVDINQKLIVVFLYVFNYEKYLLIKDRDIEALKTSDYEAFLKKYEHGYDKKPSYPFDDIGDIAYSLLKLEGTFPPTFNIDTERYLMNQQTNNLTTSEAEKIIFDNNELKKHMQVNKIDDFYRFVSVLLNENNNTLVQKIQNTALELYEQNKEGEILELVLTSMVRATTRYANRKIVVHGGKTEFFDVILDLSLNNIKLKRPLTNLNKQIGRLLNQSKQIHKNNETTATRTERFVCEWNDILEEEQFSTELKIVFLHEVLHFSPNDLFHILGLDLTLNNINAYENYTIILLNYFLTSENKFNNFSEWEDSVWNIINGMNITQHIDFWTQHNLFHQNFILTKDSKINVYFYSNDSEDKITHKEKTNIISVINKIKTISTLSNSNRIVWPESGNEIMYLQ